MTSIEDLQTAVMRALAALAVIHVPILGAIALLLGRPAISMMGLAGLLAAAPVILIVLRRPTIVVAYALVVALVGQTSLLVFTFDGHPWQVEMHFYYFAVLAMLSGFCDWKVLLVAAGLIAAHHLSLNMVLPAAVYPGGTNIVRVLVHAVVVVIETVMLVGIGQAIRAAFAQAQAARHDAEAAATALERNVSLRETELATTVKRADLLSELVERFQREIGESTEILHSAAQSLAADAATLNKTAADANHQAIAATKVSAETSHKVQIAAAGGEELATTIAEVGASAARSSQLAAGAVAEAVKTSATIDELASVAAEIGKVTDLISAIAGQTNLLALNATIEAARAGEAGRGFAVVAQEVKELAGQTAAATMEIGERIAAMQLATGRSVQAIQAISSTIRTLNQFSAKIAESVEQHAAIARDIAGNANAGAAGVHAVSSTIIQFEGVAQHASQSASKLDAAAAGVSNQTQLIRERARLLTQEIRTMTA